MVLPPAFLPVLSDVCQKLQHRSHWAFRGTTSLVLQGLDMGLQDIDIVCDKSVALSCNDLFKDHLVQPVKFAVSNQFKSYFGQLKIGGILVEIMGDWQIKSQERWSEIFAAQKPLIAHISLNGITIPVTTINTELRMFALMGRWSAYHKIKKQVV